MIGERKMCGIWGIVDRNKKMPTSVVKEMIRDLMLLSEVRGKEASGIAVLNSDRLAVMKRSISANDMLKSKEYLDFTAENLRENEEMFIIGHSRLITNGEEPDNNQPVVKHKIAMVHNGIIVNDRELWEQNKELKREYEVDTEIVVELLNKYLKDHEVEYALEKVYAKIRGMASTISITMEKNCLAAASNNGSLYYCSSQDNKIAILASEKLTIEKVVKKYKQWMGSQEDIEIEQLNSNGMMSWKINRSNDADIIQSDTDKGNAKMRAHYNILSDDLQKGFDINFDKIKKIRRCSKCVLPETMPFIKFDEHGVCNYCRSYEKQIYKGKPALIEWAEQLRKQGKENKCMVSFSGGRDSSYGLHYFVKELNLKPITYCYDWGMVTDLARRNQSRMCSQLGVEFILVSADIRKKRNNIRKNILAWMKNPDLGMIPLFMAGDKHYYYYANKVCKDYGIDNILLASNPFEKTYFKYGFCGIKPDILKKVDNPLDMERLPYKDVMRMTMYYLKQYMHNPAYINSSLFDTFTAAMSYYVIPHNYFRLFDYIEWEEKEVNKVLLEEYDWETADDTNSTWRIGDGTSPFYNYIYCLVAGFSENDTLRSNQIREGKLSREEALKLVYQDNTPRFDTMKWYFDVLNLDMREVLKIVQKMPKLYE